MKVLIFADSHGYNMAMAFAVNRTGCGHSLRRSCEDAREIEARVPSHADLPRAGGNDFDPDVPLNAVVTPGGVRGYVTHGHREACRHAA